MWMGVGERLEWRLRLRDGAQRLEHGAQEETGMGAVWDWSGELSETGTGAWGDWNTWQLIFTQPGGPAPSVMRLLVAAAGQGGEAARDHRMQAAERARGFPSRLVTAQSTERCVLPRRPRSVGASAEGNRLAAPHLPLTAGSSGRVTRTGCHPPPAAVLTQTVRRPHRWLPRGFPSLTWPFPRPHHTLTFLPAPWAVSPGC